MFNIKNALRVIHGLITLFFGLCVIQIYYSFFTNTRSNLLFLALIAVYIEGVVVFIFNKGECPLIHFHNKFGDNKTFFELFFPKRIAKKVIPTVAVITLIGSGLLLLQQFKLL